MGYVLEKLCGKNHNTHFTFNNVFKISCLERKNSMQPERTESANTIWRTCFSSWITRATNAHSEFVIVTAFPLQQCLQERASILRYTCTDCIVIYFFQPRYVFLANSFFWLFSSKPSECVCVCVCVWYREGESIDDLTTMWAIDFYLFTVTLEWLEITICSPRLARFHSHFLYVYEVILFAWHTRT